MKLTIDNLIKPVIETKPIEIAPIKVGTPFMEGVVQNISQVMQVLDAMGIKDIFVQRIRKEVEQRFSGNHGGETVALTKKAPKMDLDKIITLALVWLDRFIEQNGDMPLTQFREEVEKQKPKIIEVIRSLGI